MLNRAAAGITAAGSGGTVQPAQSCMPARLFIKTNTTAFVNFTKAHRRPAATPVAAPRRALLHCCNPRSEGARVRGERPICSQGACACGNTRAPRTRTQGFRYTVCAQPEWYSDGASSPSLLPLRFFLVLPYLREHA